MSSSSARWWEVKQVSGTMLTQSCHLKHPRLRNWIPTNSLGGVGGVEKNDSSKDLAAVTKKALKVQKDLSFRVSLARSTLQVDSTPTSRNISCLDGTWLQNLSKSLIRTTTAAMSGTRSTTPPLLRTSWKVIKDKKIEEENSKAKEDESSPSVDVTVRATATMGRCCQNKLASHPLHGSLARIWSPPKKCLLSSCGQWHPNAFGRKIEWLRDRAVQLRTHHLLASSGHRFWIPTRIQTGHRSLVWIHPQNVNSMVRPRFSDLVAAEMDDCTKRADSAHHDSHVTIRIPVFRRHFLYSGLLSVWSFQNWCDPKLHMYSMARALLFFDPTSLWLYHSLNCSTFL